MNRNEDPFIVLGEEQSSDEFAALVQRKSSASSATATALAAPIVARLSGFDLLEQPLLGDLSTSPGQILSARTTVPLRRSMVGRSVVVLLEGGDPMLPIIVGLLESNSCAETHAGPPSGVSVEADGEVHHLTAEREIVLRCGDASITLTRAGKVIIQGKYVVSRSTGYNKIKGAAIDIN